MTTRRRRGCFARANTNSPSAASARTVSPSRTSLEQLEASGFSTAAGSHASAPRALGRIQPSSAGLLRRIRDLERELPLREPLAQPRELELDDVGELLPRERLEPRRPRPRLRNSGRSGRAARSAADVRVMMITALRNRPCGLAVGQRPSSSSCRRTSNTSECAFFDLVGRTTVYGRRRTAAVSWPPSS